MRFVHDTLPQRVCFGSGEAAANLAAVIADLAAGRVMLIASKNTMHLADEIAADVPVALRHDEVVMHVPVEVAGRGRAAAPPSGGHAPGQRGRGGRPPPAAASTPCSASAGARRPGWPRRSR